jgi:hypothetical protein
MKIMRLKETSQINGDDPDIIRCEASRYFRNKKREYLKARSNELAMNSKKTRALYQGIKKFKLGYKPRSNLVKDENGDLLVDSHNALNRWKYFSVNKCT